MKWVLDFGKFSKERFFRIIKSWKFIFRLTVLILVSAGIFIYYYSDKFYPNTYVNGVAVSGMTYEEARERIRTALKDIKANGLNLEFTRGNNVRKANIPDSISGFTPDTVVEYFAIGDIEVAIKNAYERGREPSFFTRWYRIVLSLLLKKTYVIPYSIQKEAVFSLLKRELNGYLNGPKDAEFIQSDGKIIVSEGKLGADIDYEKVVAEMDNAIFNADTKNLRFEVNQIAPPITADDLKQKLEFANALAKSDNLEFRSGAYWWRVKGLVLASWLTVNKNDKEKIEIKTDKLKNFFRLNIDSSIEGKVVNSRFEMRNGKLVETVAGKAGLEVSYDKLKADIERELQRVYGNYLWNNMKPKTLVVKFTIEKVQPKATKESIEQYKITDMLGRAKTSFTGSSASRINNIKLGASKLNGILIAPGEEFSAVEGIGIVNEETGYEKEFVIKVDKSVKEFGGGLCQIATTLFRAALDAGLAITERQNHSYVVGYYGPGLDATIYGPKPDLKFINDTENYVLLQAFTEGNNLIFEFYGRKDGRKVTISEVRIHDKISPPDTKYVLSPDLPLAEKKCTEHRRDGLTADVDYRVDFADYSFREQTFTSVYKPWQEVCLFGTRF